MLRYAFEMGLTLDEFNKMSPREFQVASEAFHVKMSRQFEHTRAISYMIAAANRDPKKSFPSIQKWWPLPTDGQTVRKLDEARKREIMQLYAEAQNRINVA